MIQPIEAKVYDYFIAPFGDDGRGDGSAAHPFLTLRRTLAAIEANHGGQQPTVASLGGYDRIRIIPVRASQKPNPEMPVQFRYYYDPHGTPLIPPRGSKSAPWLDLSESLRGIGLWHSDPSGNLATNGPIELNVCEAFVATAAEHRRRRNDQIAKIVFRCMTWAMILPLLGILGFLLYKAWPALTWSFITENPREGMLAGGIWAPLVGTLYLVFFSLLVAAPIGILAGVYLNEYATDNWFTRIVNLAVVNLAGVPSIVHALFGVGAFVTAMNMGYSVMAASCTLAIMTLPVIITSTKEALAGVPMSFREACWNMGATRWQTIRTIVLPNSISGILTGVILQVSRAAGETAPILFTGAVFFLDVPDSGIGKIFPYGIWDSCMALSYHLYAIMGSLSGVEGKPEVLENIRYGTAVVLIGLVLAVNSLSIGLRVYLRSRKKW